MQDIPELTEAVYVSPAFEREFKNKFLKGLDKKLLQLSVELNQIPSIPIDLGCCGTNFVFCKFFPPEQIILLSIEKDIILELLQETANSVKKISKHYRYEYAIEICVYLSQLKKKILFYIQKADNITNINKLENLKDFSENCIPKFINGILLFCNAVQQTQENQKRGDQISVIQENIQLKHKNVKLEQKIKSLMQIIKKRSEDIISKTQKIQHLKQSNTKKQVLLKRTIENLEIEIQKLHVGKQENILLIKTLKKNLKSSTKKLNEIVQKQRDTPSVQKLSPRVVVTDLKINCKRYPNPAISFFPRSHNINNKVHMSNNSVQTKNTSAPNKK